jgi:hypothetical protein
VTIETRPHAPRPNGPVLVLPEHLTPAWWALPRWGWVLARAFSPRTANTALAIAVWLPWTGQLMAARCHRGAAASAGGPARAVALLHATRRQRAAMVGGAIGGTAALAALLLSAALVYLHLFDVTSMAGATPIWLAVAVLYAAAGATLWSTRHTLAQHHPTTPGTVRIDTLAAWPRGHGAGLHHLAPQLCALADEHGVTLDLTARTPDLAARYTRLGFTQPHPDRLSLLRHPHHSDRASPHPRVMSRPQRADGGCAQAGAGSD